ACLEPRGDAAVPAPRGRAGPLPGDDADHGPENSAAARKRCAVGRGADADSGRGCLRMSIVDVQQRIARLEGLLARVRERRGVSRAPINHGAHAEAAERPETLPPDAYDEVVDLADEDI